MLISISIGYLFPEVLVFVWAFDNHKVLRGPSHPLWRLLTVVEHRGTISMLQLLGQPYIPDGWELVIIWPHVHVLGECGRLHARLTLGQIIAWQYKASPLQTAHIRRLTLAKWWSILLLLIKLLRLGIADKLARQCLIIHSAVRLLLRRLLLNRHSKSPQARPRNRGHAVLMRTIICIVR